MKKRLSLSQIQTLDLDELEALMNTADDPRSIEMILKRMDEIDPPDPEAEERDQQLMDALMERRRCFLIAEERCSQYEEAHGKGGVCTVSDEEYLHAKQVWLRGEEIRRRISDTECSWFIHTFEQKRRKRERKMLISALAAAVLIFALGVMAAFRLSKKPHGFFGPGSVFFFVLLFRPGKRSPPCGKHCLRRTPHVSHRPQTAFSLSPNGAYPAFFRQSVKNLS